MKNLKEGGFAIINDDGLEWPSGTEVKITKITEDTTYDGGLRFTVCAHKIHGVINLAAWWLTAIERKEAKTIEQELEELREKIAHQDSCLDKQYLIQERQKQQYATLLEIFEKQQKKIEVLEERIKMQQKQIDIAMHYISSLQQKCGDIGDK